jgi:choline monooxygenase
MAAAVIIIVFRGGRGFPFLTSEVPGIIRINFLFSASGASMSETLLAKLRAFDPRLPLERAHTIPSFWYFDEEIATAERQHVFAASWQVAGLAAQVAAPGSFLTADIAGEPILVVRDEEGVLRALANVCRHRGAQVVTGAAGQVSRLRCRYHGWTYDLKGRLRGVPEFDGVQDFCREEQGLPPVAVSEWGPYVWVHLGQSPQPLREFLTPLVDRTQAVGLEQLRFVARKEYLLNCNWKVFVDNYLDGGYHVNTVHPGLASALDYAHYRTELAGHTSVQVSPMRPARDEVVGKVRTGATAYYWWVFPNFMLNHYSGVMDVNVVLPLGTDRCRVLIDWFFPTLADPAAEQWAHESIALSDTIQVEDITICEETQRGLRSRSYQSGRFSVQREAGVHHFHRLLAQWLTHATVGERI